MSIVYIAVVTDDSKSCVNLYMGFIGYIVNNMIS